MMLKFQKPIRHVHVSELPLEIGDSYVSHKKLLQTG